MKVAMAALVAIAVGRYARNTWDDFVERGESPHVEGAWVAAACGLYLAGLSCFGLFFGRVLKTRTGPALRAYFASQLGKYVPGKAMVVVLRSGIIANDAGVRPATAAFATLYETLVMMAAGGLVATVGFLLAPSPIQALPALASVGLGCGFLLLVEPRVFPRLSTVVRLPFPNVGADALPSLSHRRLVEGLLIALTGWIFLGLSQLAVFRAIFREGVPLDRWPLIFAGVALATVVGFVSGLPGGAGVREWVLLSTMAPAIGKDRAVVSALALRLAWVVAEVVAAALLLAWRPKARAREAA